MVTIERTSRADEIRHVAAAKFEEQGYSATTMNDIAAAVGMLPGSLYHHFASKEDIAIAVLSSFDTELDHLGSTVLARQRAAPQPPEKNLRQLAAEMTALSRHHGAAVQLRGFDAPKLASSRLNNALQNRSASSILAWMETVAATGTLSRRPDPDVALLTSVLRFWTLQKSFQYLAEDVAATWPDLICDVLLQGLFPDPPDDERLDRSKSSGAARELIARWKVEDQSAIDDRSRIIAAARVEFARRGYDSTTVRDIAETAGVRPGTLYRRVESKEAMLAEILGKFSGRLSESVNKIFAVEAPAVEMLDGLARVLIHANLKFRDESEIVKTGWSTQYATNSPFNNFWRDTAERLQAIQDFLEQADDRGEIRSFAPSNDMAPIVRDVLFLPFRNFGRCTEKRALAFFRETSIRGWLT